MSIKKLFTKEIEIFNKTIPAPLVSVKHCVRDGLELQEEYETFEPHFAFDWGSGRELQGSKSLSKKTCSCGAEYVECVNSNGGLITNVKYTQE